MSIVQSDRCIDLYSRYIFVDCSTLGFDNARFLAIANWLSLEQTLRLTRSGQEKNAQSFESVGCVTPSDSLGARTDREERFAGLPCNKLVWSSGRDRLGCDQSDQRADQPPSIGHNRITQEHKEPGWRGNNLPNERGVFLSFNNYSRTSTASIVL